MQIISKHSDYYDIMQSYGIDKTLRFHRITKVLQYDEINLSKLKLYYDTDEKKLIDTELALLGFCDELYPLIIVTPLTKSLDKITNKREIFYDYTTFSDKYEYRRYKFFTTLVYDRFNEITNDFKRNLSDYWNNTVSPYFVIHRVSEKIDDLIFTVNPILADYKFQQIKLAEEAYQQIYQFMGIIKTRHKPEVKEISNKEKIIKAGFNKKSFRK